MAVSQVTVICPAQGCNTEVTVDLVLVVDSWPEEPGGNWCGALDIDRQPMAAHIAQAHMPAIAQASKPSTTKASTSTSKK